MERAFASLRRSGPPASALRPWLLRIVHNEAINVLRRRGTTATMPADEALWGTGPSADRDADRRHELRELVGDMQDLSERQRSALVMRELSGLTHLEIGEALELEANAAKQAIFEARSALADMAKGRAMACEDVSRKISNQEARARRNRRVRAHLRSCASCRDFEAAIGRRSEAFSALAPPLGLAGAGSVLGRVLAGGSRGGGAASLGAKAGGGLGVKAVVGSVALTVGAAGTAGVVVARHHSHHGHARTAIAAPRSRRVAGGAIAATALSRAHSARAHQPSRAAPATAARPHRGRHANGVAPGSAPTAGKGHPGRHGTTTTTTTTTIVTYTTTSTWTATGPSSSETVSTPAPPPSAGPAPGATHTGQPSPPPSGQSTGSTAPAGTTAPAPAPGPSTVPTTATAPAPATAPPPAGHATTTAGGSAG
jgi:RNA polymerase sigma factor (sigma-70 family)